MPRQVRILSLVALVSACGGQSGEARAVHHVSSQGGEGATAVEHERNGEEVGQMMVIRVVLEVGPEHRVAFREHMAQESGRVRSMEGCMRYELYADPSNEDRFLLYEEWSSPGAFETFQASDLLRESFAVLVPMMTGPPDSAYYQARLQPQ